MGDTDNINSKGERTRLGNVAGNNHQISDETGETKLNMMHTRRVTITIKQETDGPDTGRHEKQAQMRLTTQKEDREETEKRLRRQE